MRFTRTIKTIALTNVVSGFSRYPLWILLALYFATVRHLSDEDIAIIFLLSGAASSPFSIFGGRFADRAGRRPLLLGTILAMIAGYGLLFVSVTYGWSIAIIVIALVSVNVLNSLEFVGISAVVTDVSSVEQRLDYFSLQRVAGNAGIGAGLVLAGFSSEFWPGLFFLAPVLGAVVEVILFWGWIPESLTSPEKSTLPPPQRHLLRAFRDKRLLAVAVLLPLAALVANQWETPMMPLYLNGHFGTPIYLVTVLYAVNCVTVVSLQFLVNRVSKRVGAGIAFSLGLLLYAVSDVVFWMTGNPLVLAANVVLLTSGENFTTPYSQVILSKIAPEDRRGEYFGVSALFSGVILPFSPFVGTFMLGYFSQSLYWMWAILAGGCVLFAVLFLPVQRWLERSPPPPRPVPTTALRPT